jgi:MerR, DNA binding
MSLDEIGEMLSGSGESRRWSEIMADRIAVLDAQIARMQGAREFLEHVASKHRQAPDGCPHFEALIWQRTSGAAEPEGELAYGAVRAEPR